MNHRHFMLAYLVTWFLQLGYLGTILVGWQRSRSSRSRLKSGRPNLSVEQ